MPRWAPIMAVMLLGGALPARAVPARVRAVDGAQQLDACAIASARGYAIAWVDARPLSREVRASFSDDGTVWSTAPSLSGPGARDESMHPGCAAQGDEVVVTWATARDGDHDVYAARSRDGGRSFDPPTRVAGGAGGQLAPRAAIGVDGRAYVVFHDSFGSTDEDGGVVWRVRISWSDPGAPWSPATTVDRGPAFGLFPAVDVSASGRLYVAWLSDDRILAATASDVLSAWSMPVALASRAVGGPAIALHDEGLDVVFTASSTAADQRDPSLLLAEPSYLDVHQVRTSTSLELRSASRAVNVRRALNQLQPSIAGRHVVWLDHGEAGVRRVRGTDELERDLSDNDPAREVEHPSVACGPRACLVAWSEEGDDGAFELRATTIE